MLGSKAKRELKRNQRRILIDSIEIGIPSPQQIYTWGERRLPNGNRVGEIKNSKTVNYKRFTPLRDGLFCERIFGPVNSFVVLVVNDNRALTLLFVKNVKWNTQINVHADIGWVISPWSLQ